MADQKISQLTEKTTSDANDEYAIVDSITGLNRKRKVERLPRNFIDYYVSSTGNDSTAIAGQSNKPYALVSVASAAALADKAANNNNNRVYIKTGGSIKDNEINRSGIPIFAEDGAVVWTDQAARAVISDRLLGEFASIDIQGQGTFVHTNPSLSSNQAGVNFRGDAPTGTIQAKLIDSIKIAGDFTTRFTITDCTILVGTSPNQKYRGDVLLQRCIIEYGLIGSADDIQGNNNTIENSFIICGNAYDRVITDKEGNTVTTVVLSGLIPDRLIDSHSWRCEITGTSGGGNLVVDAINYGVTFNTDLETTVDDFVDTHAAALLAVADQVVSKRWKEIQLTGTSGTSTITLAATPYLATFNTDLATTAADFITSHGSAITTQGFRVVQFGDILAFSKTAEAVFTLTVANTTGDLNGTISYQIHLGSVYDNYFTATFANTSGDLGSTILDHFTEAELQNRVAASGLTNEYGYAGFYFQNSSGNFGYSINWTIINCTVLLRKNKAIGFKIVSLTEEFDGQFGGIILRNTRVKKDFSGGNDLTAAVYGKDDALARPLELDIYSFAHQVTTGPIGISVAGYSAPVIRSNDPSTNNGGINFSKSSIKTISSGVIAAGNDRNLIIAAESGTADDLIEITGLTVGDEILVRADTGDTITLKHNDAGATIKLLITADADLVLDEGNALRLSQVDTNVLSQNI